MKRIADQRSKATRPGRDVSFVKVRLTKTWHAYIRSDLFEKHRRRESAAPRLLAHDRASYADAR
jgi:hypothetical protein